MLNKKRNSRIHRFLRTSFRNFLQNLLPALLIFLLLLSSIGIASLPSNPEVLASSESYNPDPRSWLKEGTKLEYELEMDGSEGFHQKIGTSMEVLEVSDENFLLEVTVTVLESSLRELPEGYSKSYQVDLSLEECSIYLSSDEFVLYTQYPDLLFLSIAAPEEFYNELPEIQPNYFREIPEAGTRSYTNEKLGIEGKGLQRITVSLNQKIFGLETVEISALSDMGKSWEEICPSTKQKVTVDEKWHIETKTDIDMRTGLGVYERTFINYKRLSSCGDLKEDLSFTEVVRLVNWNIGGIKAGEFQIRLAESMDIYPTEPNSTVVEISYQGISLRSPIQLEIEGELPPWIDASLSPEVLTPSPRGTSKSRLNVFLNCSKAEELKLPMIYDLAITASSGNHKVSKNITLNLLPAKWLLMIYLAADLYPDPNCNLESCMLYNFYEVLNATKHHGTPEVGITMLVDLRYKAVLPQEIFGFSTLPPNHAILYLISKGNLTRIGGDWGPVNTSSPEALRGFIEKSMKQVPAEHTHLIISDHGAGMRGIVCDYHQGRKLMKIPSLARAFKGHRFDVISFDACLMAQAEVLYHLKNYTDYFTASEIEVPCWGYNYSAFVKDLLIDPNMNTEKYLKDIIRSYEGRYEGYRYNITLSAINSSKLEELATAVDLLSKALNSGYERSRSQGGDFNRTLIDLALSSWEVRSDPYVDIKDFAQRIVNSSKITDERLKEAAKRVVRALEEAVIDSVQKICSLRNGALIEIDSGYNGLTIFLWKKGMSKTMKVWYGVTSTASSVFNLYLEDYIKTSFSRSTEWRSFVKNLALSSPSNVISVRLSHSGHELHLHVYDSRGNHVGFNPLIVNQSRSQIELQIPGSIYVDLRNGTKIILLPPDLKEFSVVVDGLYMEEDVEPYELAMTAIVKGEETPSKTVSGHINRGMKQQVDVKLEDGELILGGTSTITPIATTVITPETTESLRTTPMQTSALTPFPSLPPLPIIASLKEKLPIWIIIFILVVTSLLILKRKKTSSSAKS